jgi:hypothetical protein
MKSTIQTIGRSEHTTQWSEPHPRPAFLRVHMIDGGLSRARLTSTRRLRVAISTRRLNKIATDLLSQRSTQRIGYISTIREHFRFWLLSCPTQGRCARNFKPRIWNPIPNMANHGTVLCTRCVGITARARQANMRIRAMISTPGTLWRCFGTNFG